MKYLAVLLLLQVTCVTVLSVKSLQEIIRHVGRQDKAHRLTWTDSSKAYLPRHVEGGWYNNDRDDNTGYATNCGPKEQNFTFSWTPKIVKTSQEIHLHLSVIAPFSFSSGVGRIEIKRDGTEVLAFDQEVNCKMALKYVKDLKCPISKGDSITIDKSLVDVTAIPEGLFDVIVTLTSDQGKLLMCAKIHVQVV